jgi:transposase-like protein
MARQRRRFDTSLKLEVVRMLKEQGLSVQNVSETMNIGPTAIRRWVTAIGRARRACRGRVMPWPLHRTHPGGMLQTLSDIFTVEGGGWPRSVISP